MPDRKARRQLWRAEAMVRHAAVVDALAGTARHTDDEVRACLFWLGARRQARRHLRTLQARGIGDRQEDVRTALEAVVEDADFSLASAGPAVVEQARSRLGLRIAVVGKGGTGKSLVSGTLARLLAQRGRPVLAVDLDTNPGLAFSIGVPPTDGRLPDEAVEEFEGAPYGWRLRGGLTPADAVEHHGVHGPDGVRFLGLGKIGDSEKRDPKRTVAALREVLDGFGEPGWDVIGDLEAGPTTPFEGYHLFAEQALVVVTPTWVSAMTARRLLPIVDDLDTLVVANQLRGEPDHRGLAPVVRIPWDRAAADAERRGLAPLDVCPDSPAIAAIAALADALTHQEVTV
ncbi:MAG TPA: hypothetical protein VM287_11370 [Egibacteraceae bacterium]|nr:hypothetical protein [Egibacteraceae bacterium]